MPPQPNEHLSCARVEEVFTVGAASAAAQMALGDAKALVERLGRRIDSNQESLVRSVLNTWQQENMVSPSAVSVELIRAFCTLIETNDLGALGRCDRDSVLSAGPVGVVLGGLSVIQTNVASFMSIMFTEKELAAVVRAGGRRAEGQFEPRRWGSIQQRRAYAVVRSTIFDLMGGQMRGGGVVRHPVGPLGASLRDSLPGGIAGLPAIQ